MPLRDFMTETATTTRIPVSGGESGTIATHLENVLIVKPQLPSATGQHAIRQMLGLEGSATQVWQTWSESHQHTDDSSTVTQVPDIVAGDRLTVNGIEYYVRWAEPDSETTSFGDTLVIYITKSKRG